MADETTDEPQGPGADEIRGLIEDAELSGNTSVLRRRIADLFTRDMDDEGMIVIAKVMMQQQVERKQENITVAQSLLNLKTFGEFMDKARGGDEKSEEFLRRRLKKCSEKMPLRLLLALSEMMRAYQGLELETWVNHENGYGKDDR